MHFGLTPLDSDPKSGVPRNGGGLVMGWRYHGCRRTKPSDTIDINGHQPTKNFQKN